MFQKMANCKKALTICLFLTIVVFAAFWQVKNNDFVNYDDPRCVPENIHIQRGFNANDLKWACTTSHAGYWQPLTWLSLMLDFQIFGLNPGGYHIVNLLFHITSSILLFLIFNRMTGAMWQSAFIAALFALHPLHAESVAWVAERKDVLSALFWMLTMGAYVLYVEKPDTKKYLLVILLFSLGLMAKPMLVTLPFALLLLDYWPLCRLLSRRSAAAIDEKATESKKKRSKGKQSPVAVTAKSTTPGDQVFSWSTVWPLVREKLPFIIPVVASSIMTLIGQQKAGAIESLDTLPIGIRLGNAVVSYVGYIGKTIYPYNLAVFYPLFGMRPVWEICLAGILIFAATFMIIRKAKTMPYLAVGWLWYLGTLVPVIGIIQVGMQSMADRYTYIPLIGLFAATAWAVPGLVRNWPHRQAILAAGAAVVLSACACLTFIQVSYWRNSFTLFEHAIRVVDNNYLAHNNLAVALAGAGKNEEAVAHYKEAIGIKPTYENAHFNLANHLSRQGKTDEAIEHYLEALKLRPTYAKAHNNLAMLLALRQNFNEAISHYQAALQSDPTNAGIRFNLGVAMMATHRPAEARDQFQEALRINPGFAEAYNELGILSAQSGRTDEAIGYFRQALWLKPGYDAARRNLALALEVQKKSHQ